jgi:hypothetical protein
MRFEAVVELGAKTATGLEVPGPVVEQLGSGKRPAVTVTINGHSYPSTIASRGGRYLVPLSAENRAAAGVEAGDTVTVDLALDTAVRRATVPPELAEAFAADPAAKATFDALTYTHQREWTLWIDGAKKPETRAARAEKTIAQLRDGQGRR